MKKYFYLVLSYIKINLQAELTYRSNSVFTFISTMTYTLVFILTLGLIFDFTDSIGGYSYDQMYVILMLGQLWWLVQVQFVRSNFKFIAKSINDGTLDYILLKPYNLRVIIPFIKFDFRHVPPMLVAIYLLFIKLDFSGMYYFQIVAAILFFINGVMITYFITSIFISFNFWAGRNNSIFDISLKLPDLVQLPIDFFPLMAKNIFIFLIPVIIIVNPTFQILYNRIDYVLLIEAAVVSLVLFLVSEFTWKQGLKKYTSAN